MMQDSSVLYIRELPGGGFVCIEAWPTRSDILVRGSLLVERRSDPERRDGHEPPVVLQVDAATPREVFDRLVEVADSNVAVAAALRRWQGSRGADIPGGPRGLGGGSGDGGADHSSGASGSAH